jgi:hypothetical protein
LNFFIDAVESARDFNSVNPMKNTNDRSHHSSRSHPILQARHIDVAVKIPLKNCANRSFHLKSFDRGAITSSTSKDLMGINKVLGHNLQPIAASPQSSCPHLKMKEK